MDSLNQLKTIKPDIIFHMAIYNHVGDSFLHSSEAIKVMQLLLLIY